MSSTETRIACLDTQIVIWAALAQSSENQKDMLWRSRALVRWLGERGARVVVSAISVGEMLVKVPVAKHQATIAEMNVFLQIVPYDAHAASRFASMWEAARAETKPAAGQQGRQGVRDKLKTDLMIAATAIVAGARDFYTEDGDLRRILKGHIAAHQVPRNLTEQKDLFEEPGPFKPAPRKARRKK